MRLVSLLMIALLYAAPLAAQESSPDSPSQAAPDTQAASALDAQAASASNAQTASEVDTANRAVILYGTDAEILSLTAVLKESGDSSLDPDLASLLTSTKNAKLQEAVYDYFLSRPDSKEEEGALAGEVSAVVDDFSLEVLTYWDQYRESIIDRACRYLALRRERRALEPLLDLLESASDALRPRIVNTLGKIGGEGIAGPLIAWLGENDPSSTLKNDIYRALGATQDREAASGFIKTALEDEYASPTEKMALLEAAGALKDPALLGPMLSLLSDDDANVRASVIASLGGYGGEDVEKALLDAFRDNFYKARIAAAKAAAERGLASAVPYLVFRAERDSVLSVQLAAIEALGKFDEIPVRDSLKKILEMELKGDAVRAASAKTLLEIDQEAFMPVVIEVMEKSVLGKKQKPLYHELARLVSTRIFAGARDLAARLIASDVVTDRHYALDLVRANRLADLYNSVKKLDTGKTDSLSRKARTVRKILEDEGLVESSVSGSGDAGDETAEEAERDGKAGAASE